MNTIKIAVYGGTKTTPAARETAAKVGALLKKHNFTMITGAATGVSEIASAAAYGAPIIGYSPQKNADDTMPTVNEAHLTQVHYCTLALSEMSKSLDLQDTPEVKFKFRNFLSAAATDAAIAICGGMGTLTEVINCVALGKKTFLMRGTGGTADVASAMLDMLNIDRNLYQDIFSVEELEAELLRLGGE